MHVCVGAQRRFMMLLPCHGHHRLIDGMDETLLYGKRMVVCVEPSAFAKHAGVGEVVDDGLELSADDRRGLLLSFYTHAVPLLPRMCRAAGDVGALEGKGGPGPRTSEVYLCSQVQHPDACMASARAAYIQCLACLNFACHRTSRWSLWHVFLPQYSY